MRTSAKSVIIRLVNSGTQGSKYTFAGIVGAQAVWAGYVLSQLHKEGIVSIVGWDRVYQHWTPVFARQTHMPDAPKPPPGMKDYSPKRVFPQKEDRRTSVSEWYSSIKQLKEKR